MKLEGESLPLAVRDSEERLSKGGVYLLETGLHLFLWVGANAQQELLLNIFGTPSFGQIDPSLTSLPVLDNPFSQRLREIVHAFRAQRSRYMKDTAVWDPSTCPRPSSCSTPNRLSSWSEVVVRGHKRDSGPDGAVPLPRLSLSNQYAALSADTPCPTS
ncbi:hypothetical protein CRUP_037321 [Coryphaenoides rupestris]|nr:hypothetical protein CRUP_037321 [Coryphaenoides rupestris]